MKIEDQTVCKDCRHCVIVGRDEWLVCNIFFRRVQETFYCGHAERKPDGTDRAD